MSVTLDTGNFPVGYGEEDDYCFRATDAGYALVVATHTYVFHAKSKSYGAERRLQLAREGARRLRLKHGSARIDRATLTMARNPLLTEQRIRAKEFYLSRHPGSKHEER